MVQKREASAVVTSLAVHALILAALFMVRYAVAQQVQEIDIETVFEENERELEDFHRDMQEETEVSETLETFSGGMVSSEVGGGNTSARAQQQIENSETMKDPDFQIDLGVPAPKTELLGDQLAFGEVNGETGVAVPGYDAAMSRLTMELRRLMRSGERLMVVWLFDESDSMRNDQKMLRDEFHKVYEELRLVETKDKRIPKGKEVLLTAIHSYGKGLSDLTDKPTDDSNKIKSAIDKIQVDDSGEENMCAAIAKMVEKYSTAATRGDRRLVIVVVTDESGDDGDAFDLTLAKVKKARAPCYILSRESIFGYPYAKIRWKDPLYGLTHWLNIRRGPETAYAEALQYDGLHGRWDAQSAGFGPYEQERLAKESGGIFFVLPSEEENLVTNQLQDQRKYRFESMREYSPLLLPRTEYAQERDKSEFRSKIWEVIVHLNPHRDPELNIREHWYSNDPEEFRKEAKTYFNRALRAMKMLNEGVAILEGVKELREEESSQRWRANFDLAYAQVLAYRVRLFQYLLAMDKHAEEFPAPKNPKSNRWNLRRTPKMLPPSEKQIQATKVDMDELNKQLAMAEDRFRFVIYEHPGTPWAYRAQYELNQGFGMEFVDVFRDPRYDEFDSGKIKLPKQ